MGLEAIHNYYEQLVAGALHDALAGSERMADQDFIEDVACVALNQLPARYVRHNVDLVFYMTPQERAQIGSAVQDAVRMAIEFVAGQAGQPRPHTFTHGGGVP